MSKYDPNIWNEKMANFLGYTHREDNVMRDLSDAGGVYESMTIMSKVPIEIGKVETTKYKGVEYTHKWLAKVKPSVPDEWADKEICWASENYGNFIYLRLWNPDKDWNQIMRVVSEIELDTVCSNIDQAYRDCCKCIENRL